MKNYNTRLIRAGRTYTPSEIAKLYNIGTGTVYRWLKDGLQPIEQHKNPLLIYGHELRRFLLKRQEKHKKKLGPEEFYCVKCRSAQNAKPEAIRLVKTGKKIGKENRDQYQKVAPCKDCGTEMRRFS